MVQVSFSPLLCNEWMILWCLHENLLTIISTVDWKKLQTAPAERWMNWNNIFIHYLQMTRNQQDVFSSSVTCWNDSLMFEVWFGLIMKPSCPRPSDLLDFKQLLSTLWTDALKPLKLHLCRRRSSLIPSCSGPKQAGTLGNLLFDI